MPDLFPPSYVVARDRILDAAASVQATTGSCEIAARGPDGARLTVDVITVGARRPAATIVISSGLHGIEGFAGSAVQLAWLRDLAAGRVSVPDGAAVTIVHALNPYGFAWRRRTDEHNVDLNRNFLADDADEGYVGVPPHYEDVHRLLNPDSSPSRFEPFRLKAAWVVWRLGRVAARAAVASGQYEHPAGLFFGGTCPTQVTRLVRERFWSWTREAPDVVHVDLHTGLGAFGDYQFLVEPVQAAHLDWFRTRFGADRVVSVAGSGAYTARGVMGAWLARDAGARRYRFVCAEFGTYSMLGVLAALRDENRAHRHSQPGDPVHARATRQLVECFCPASPRWRRLTVRGGIGVIELATAASRRVGG